MKKALSILILIAAGLQAEHQSVQSTTMTKNLNSGKPFGGFSGPQGGVVMHHPKGMQTMNQFQAKYTDLMTKGIIEEPELKLKCPKKYTICRHGGPVDFNDPFQHPLCYKNGTQELKNCQASQDAMVVVEKPLPMSKRKK